MRERGGPLVAAVLVLAVLVVVLPDEERPTVEAPSVRPEEALTAAWERSRSTELVVRYDVVRTFPDGRELVFRRTHVQRPPDDELNIGGGSASGRLGGRIIRCNVIGSGPPTCVQGAAAPAWADVVEREVRTLARLVDPAEGDYDVAVDEDGCFTLTLDGAVSSLSYGNETRLCFDPASGTLAEIVVERDEAVERSEAVEIRTEVVAGDLRAEELGEPLGQ